MVGDLVRELWDVLDQPGAAAEDREADPEGPPGLAAVDDAHDRDAQQQKRQAQEE